MWQLSLAGEAGEMVKRLPQARIDSAGDRLLGSIGIFHFPIFNLRAIIPHFKVTSPIPIGRNAPGKNSPYVPV